MRRVLKRPKTPHEQAALDAERNQADSRRWLESDERADFLQRWERGILLTFAATGFVIYPILYFAVYSEAGEGLERDFRGARADASQRFSGAVGAALGAEPEGSDAALGAESASLAAAGPPGARDR